MPLHLDSLTRKDTSGLLAWILQVELQGVTEACASADKLYVLGSTPLIDRNTKTEIGKYIFTMFINAAKKATEILDIDIVLNNDTPVELVFERKLKQSSRANEYYEITTTETEHHLNIETVNRYIVDGEIEGSTMPVYASAFPFRLTIFDDQAAYNKFCGFEKAVELANTGMFVHGLGTQFTMPGGLGGKDSDEDPWTFLVGTINSYREITIAFGKDSFEAYIIDLDTALGALPTLVGKDVFDTGNIAVGKIVAMDACIKANFSSGKYPKPPNT